MQLLSTVLEKPGLQGWLRDDSDIDDGLLTADFHFLNIWVHVLFWLPFLCSDVE